MIGSYQLKGLEPFPMSSIRNLCMSKMHEKKIPLHTGKLVSTTENRFCLDEEHIR